MDSLDSLVTALRSAFEGRKVVAPSFGAVRATLSEVSICNSEGLRTGYGHTVVELELGVSRSVDRRDPAGGVFGERIRPTPPADRSPATRGRSCRFAEDVRRGRPPPTGEMAVVMPPSVVTDLPDRLWRPFHGGSPIATWPPRRA